MNDEFIENGDPYDVCLVVMGVLLSYYRAEGIPPDFEEIKQTCLKIIGDDERSSAIEECKCEYFKQLGNYKCYYCTYLKGE